MTDHITTAADSFTTNAGYTGAFKILAPSQFVSIRGTDGTELVRIDLKTGQHTFADEARMDEAARRFWDAVEALQPSAPVTHAMRQAVRREECQIAGHNFDVSVDVSGGPIQLICPRCGEKWDVRDI